MNPSMLNTNNTIEIKSNDVVQLMLQYLKENKFENTFKTFQEESGITLNQLNHKKFVEAFKQSNWTEVITQLSDLMLSQELFYTTYQFICDSLIENDKFQAASFIIEQVIKPNIKQMGFFRQKIMRLQYIIEHQDQKNLYKNPPNQSRQNNILNQLFSVSTQAESQRLLRLLTQSLKYQVAEGIVNPSIKLNLFSGKQQIQSFQAETIIKQVEKTILYTQESKITEIKLSWSQEYLAIGGVDGLIELYNTKDYTLYDNEYQRQGQMFFHDHPIQAMQFNHTDQMLASVDSKGLINIWNLKTGILLRKIDKQTSINAICWGVDPSHILNGYKDTIKLYGIRSCNILKQYICNKPEFIFSIFVSQTHLYCVSTVGSYSIFNYATSELLSSLQTRQNITSCFRLYSDNISWVFSKFILAFKKKIIEYDQFAMEGKQFTVQDGEAENCIAVGDFIYICIKGSDNKYRMSVIEKNKKKVVFYTAYAHVKEEKFTYNLRLKTQAMLLATFLKNLRLLK